MSVKVMSAIWEHSPHKGSELLLLLAIADNADDRGVAWPSQETLAEKMRMSVRQVRRISGIVEASGAVTTRRRRNGSKTHIIYALTIPGGQDVLQGQDVLPGDDFQPDISAFQPDIAMSAEPSIEPSQGQELDLAAPPRTRTRRDEIWDALAAIFGEPATQTAKALRGRIVSSLLGADATVQQIQDSPAAYRARMPSGTLFTETALEKHWSLLLMPLEVVKMQGPNMKYGRRHVTGTELRAEADRLQAIRLQAEQITAATERKQLAPG